MEYFVYLLLFLVCIQCSRSDVVHCPLTLRILFDLKQCRDVSSDNARNDLNNTLHSLTLGSDNWDLCVSSNCERFDSSTDKPILCYPQNATKQATTITISMTGNCSLSRKHFNMTTFYKSSAVCASVQDDGEPPESTKAQICVTAFSHQTQNDSEVFPWWYIVGGVVLASAVAAFVVYKKLTTNNKISDGSSIDGFAGLADFTIDEAPNSVPPAGT